MQYLLAILEDLSPVKFVDTFHSLHSWRHRHFLFLLFWVYVWIASSLDGLRFSSFQFVTVAHDYLLDGDLLVNLYVLAYLAGVRCKAILRDRYDIRFELLTLIHILILWLILSFQLLLVITVHSLKKLVNNCWSISVVIDFAY